MRIDLRRARTVVAHVLALAIVLATPAVAGAAERVMFGGAGCPFCERFDRDIAPIYDRSQEGKIAPLRRVNIQAPVHDDLKFIAMEPITPVFVLVERGHETGRIRGYPGDNNFSGLLAGLIGDLRGAGGTAPE
jgi:hypothetical protein